MKQIDDNFTIDAFSAPRRGRPAVLHPLTNAQRQANYRKRIKKGTSNPVDQAKIQAAFLKATAKKITAMAADWGDLDESFMSQLEDLSGSLSDIEKQLAEYIDLDGRFD
ncbi:hypothetical protein [Undibacterium sp.]|uniref:hypothetical protein n=1 Tax=Undibacterium sp. TaxID=1914977 RepID=UPI002730C0FC|nr:hypothetical protein [Undibacterium sp.]MDP1978064.1 hypothetical protein [Undibacterium sp.]